MVDENEFKIKIKADASDVIREVANIKRDIERMRQVGGGTTNNPTAQAYKEQSSMNLKNKLTQNLKDQNNEITKMQKRYLDISKHLETAVKAHVKTNDLIKERDRLYDSIAQKEKTAANIQQAMGGSGGGGGDGRGLPGMGGGGRIGRAFLDHKRGGMGLGMAVIGRAISPAMAGLGAAAGVAGTAMSAYGTFQMNQEKWKSQQAGRGANITQFGNGIRERAINENGTEDIMFAPERAKAIDKSMSFFENTRKGRNLRSAGSVAGGVALVAGGIGTIAAGAMSTGVTAGLGTKAGAVVGGGMIAGGLRMIGSSEEAYARLMGDDKALNKMTADETIGAYKNFELNERLNNPDYYKKKFIGKNKKGLLSRQRSAGLSDEGMFGQEGFLKRGGNQFVYSERDNMQSQMVGAGGSGDVSGGLHLTALKAQRNLGMTNSGQAMGRLTSYLGQNESEEAFIKILSKGVSVGLDSSKYVEEQKDYFQQVTALAAKVGGGAENYVASSISAGIGNDISRRNIQMSAGAYGDLENDLGEQGGIVGAARAHVLSNDSTFANIKGMDFVQLQQMKPSDINVNNSQIKNFFKKSGGDPEKDKKGLANFAKKLRDGYRKGLVGGFAGTPLGDKTEELLKKIDNGEELTEIEEGQLVSNIKTIKPSQAKKSTKEVLAYARGLGGTESKMEESNMAKTALAKQKRIRSGIGLLGRRGGYQMDERMSKEDLRYSKIDRESGLGLDDEGRTAAKMQASGFEGDVSGLVSNMFKNIDKTMADQIKLEEFARAVNGGTEAMLKFMKAAGMSADVSGPMDDVLKWGIEKAASFVVQNKKNVKVK